MHTTAYAHTNIALIKYWGKLAASGNLPAVGSLSLTLDAFGTQTTVSLHDLPHDTLNLNDTKQNGETQKRVSNFLEIIRKRTKSTVFCAVKSRNDVPTKAGLASSASAFAALALAASKAYGLSLSQEELSDLARQGSGSAARSIYGGLNFIKAPQDASRVYCPAYPLSSPLLSDLRLIVVQCANGEKALSSRDAMLNTAQSSPYYSAWLQSHQGDLNAALQAVQEGDFDALGLLTEHSTLKMHASLMAAKPGYWYFKPLSLEIMALVRTLREDGLSCYFTLDAGPHVKILCLQSDVKQLQEAIVHQYGNLPLHICQAGPAARLLEEHL